MNILKDFFKETLNIEEWCKQNQDAKLNLEIDFEKWFENKMTDFEFAAKFLIKHMAEQTHPHCTCIVDSTHAELKEGIKIFHTEEFIAD